MATLLRVLAGTAALVLAAPAALSTDALPERPLPATEPPALQSLTEFPSADRVVVRKAARKLYLMNRDTVLRSYRIALGLNPVGHKERAGDFRTPEGTYRLTRRGARARTAGIRAARS
jgi:murein L,D-transpeptidase YafK